jgi:monovalent cation/hydrogen antiporter
LLVKWLKVEDRDETMPRERQETIVQKKLSLAALKVLNEKYADAVTKNEILQSLKLKHAGHVRLYENRLADKSVTPSPSIAEEDFRKVVTEVIFAQRDLLHELNKKQEVDEEIIRKYNGLLDLEEENFSVRFNEAGE